MKYKIGDKFLIKLEIVDIDEIEGIRCPYKVKNPLWQTFSYQDEKELDRLKEEESEAIDVLAMRITKLKEELKEINKEKMVALEIIETKREEIYKLKQLVEKYEND